MKTEVNPQDTNRAEAFELWMSSPMPMVTLTKTFDVSNLIRMSEIITFYHFVRRFTSTVLIFAIVFVWSSVLAFSGSFALTGGIGLGTTANSPAQKYE